MRTSHLLKWVLVPITAMAVIYAVAGILGGCIPDPDPGCEPECDYDTCEDGPYDTTQDLSSGPDYQSGLFYPDGSGPFPLFVWGCGAMSDPGDYEDHMNRIASWGFVVVAEVSTGDGDELVDAIDWAIDQNANPFSPLYNMVDASKVGAGGHSLGSMSTFQMADDDRLSTTIHVAGGSMDGMGAYNLENPAAYICGEDDSMGTDNAERDYDRTSVPVFMTIMDNVDHMSAAREGLPAISAWLLWHLAGETDRMDDFLDSDGFFQTGMWDSKSKNW